MILHRRVKFYPETYGKYGNVTTFKFLLDDNYLTGNAQFQVKIDGVVGITFSEAIDNEFEIKTHSLFFTKSMPEPCKLKIKLTYKSFHYDELDAPEIHQESTVEPIVELIVILDDKDEANGEADEANKDEAETNSDEFSLIDEPLSEEEFSDGDWPVVEKHKTTDPKSGSSVEDVGEPAGEKKDDVGDAPKPAIKNLRIEYETEDDESSDDDDEEFDLKEYLQQETSSRTFVEVGESKPQEASKKSEKVDYNSYYSYYWEHFKNKHQGDVVIEINKDKNLSFLERLKKNALDRKAVIDQNPKAFKFEDENKFLLNITLARLIESFVPKYESTNLSSINWISLKEAPNESKEKWGKLFAKLATIDNFYDVFFSAHVWDFNLQKRLVVKNFIMKQNHKTLVESRAWMNLKKHVELYMEIVDMMLEQILE